METLVQRPGVARPRAVLAFCEWAAVPETHPNAQGFRGDYAKFDAAFRIVLRIFFASLIGRRRFPVIGWFVGLGQGCVARKN